MSRHSAGSRDPVTSALQSYADRGVFRGFRATPATRQRIEHQFLWLTRRPMTAMLDSRRKTLTFPSLLPGIDRGIATELATIVKARTGRDVPPHKRVDSRRARLSSARRNGDLSLAIEIRGQNHAYAVRHALNVINEMFLVLHERHPEYLVEHFGISSE